MIEDTISEAQAQRFYDRYGKRLEFSDAFEGRAKALAWSWCESSPGQRVLELGVGTGQFQALAAERSRGQGVVVGLDISRTMLELAQERAPAARQVQGSVAALPFADQSFDWVFSSYTFDLLPLGLIEVALAEVRRVLRPEGQVVLCGLTEGRAALERLFMFLWGGIHRVAPAQVGGCRPLTLTPLLEAAGFEVLRREHVGQLGTPSEVILVRGGRSPPRTKQD
jgi:demethylmenaquinone methyltransferase/2-methoxy-6-polyprenyl-1,4-benzoquinol methylase